MYPEQTPVNYCIKFKKNGGGGDGGTDSTENAVDYENEMIEYSIFRDRWAMWNL